MQNKVPAYIKDAVRRRAAAAEKHAAADKQISEYCKALGLDTEFIDCPVEKTAEHDPFFFVEDLRNGLQRLREVSPALRRKHVPVVIIDAVMRRSSAAEKYCIADAQVSAYCKAHRLDVEFVNGHAKTLTDFDADFFICDLVESFERMKNAQEIKHKKGEDR